MDFETTLKFVSILAAAVAIPVAAYAAIYATRAIWGRQGAADSTSAGRQAFETSAVEARLADLEAGQRRIMELEERLDFAERLLAQQRNASRLGAGERE